MFLFRSFLCNILAVIINRTAFKREAVPLRLSLCFLYASYAYLVLSTWLFFVWRDTCGAAVYDVWVDTSE
jgi:hypothetical protein